MRLGDLMKRFWMLGLIVLSLAMLAGCGIPKIEKAIYEYDWAMEFISDHEGNILVADSKQSPLADRQCDLQLHFEQNGTFTLSNEANNQQWKGTFITEKPASSISLKLMFEDIASAISGVYGTREYADNTKAPTITFYTEDKIFSFIAS